MLFYIFRESDTGCLEKPAIKIDIQYVQTACSETYQWDWSIQSLLHIVCNWRTDQVSSSQFGIWSVRILLSDSSGQTCILYNLSFDLMNTCRQDKDF